MIGAGPIGLEAALYGVVLGAEVTVYESGDVADSVAAWGHIELFTPFGMNHTRLGRLTLESGGRHLPDDAEPQTGGAWRASYLLPLGESPQLRDRIQRRTRVRAIGRGDLLKGDLIGDARRADQPFRILLESAGRESYEEADIVLDASGTYRRPNWLGLGGAPALGETALAERIEYHPVDIAGARRGDYLGRTTLLVGGGYSAATSALALADLTEIDPSTRAVWLTRGSGAEPIPHVDDDPLPRRAALAEAANALVKDSSSGLRWIAGSGVTRVEPSSSGESFVVTMVREGEPVTVRCDRIVANVGYEPDDSIYRGLQIHECYASRGPMKLSAALLSATADAGGDCTQVGDLGAEALRNPEPGYFILGAKSYGRSPLFLLGAGYDQVRDIFRLIAGDESLDLYESPAVSTGGKL